MKCHFVSKKSSHHRLILLFTGWSTIPAFYDDLEVEGWDILTIYDYSEPFFDTKPIENYATIFILAWSLGVAAAEKISSELLRRNISAAFAINGTPWPAHDTKGIPTAIYDGTLEALSMRNLKKFRRRMGDRILWDYPFTIESDKSEEEAIVRLKKELEVLHDSTAAPRLPWKRAYIGDHDLIFPPDNQLSAWKSLSDRPQIVRQDSGHYLPLGNIIREITPNHSSIARRFKKAISTYTTNATAQGKIASHLISLLPDEESRHKLDRVLEIGPGSGILTEKLFKTIKVEKATFIDLYPLSEFNLAEEETYVTGDAEAWMEIQRNNSFDLIVSASTIQWFADPLRFFNNAARTLTSGGILLCSTFLPGNLHELDEMRPAPLLYRSREELESMLKEVFPYVHTEEEEITLHFSSPREALLHLKHTGVGGGSTVSINKLLRALPEKPTLTYRTLYIRADK